MATGKAIDVYLLHKAGYQDAYGSSTDKYDSSCTLISPLTSLKA